jgi:hypothetical protein
MNGLFQSSVFVGYLQIKLFLFYSIFHYGMHSDFIIFGLRSVKLKNSQQHVRLYKTVKLLQEIFNLVRFSIVHCRNHNNLKINKLPNLNFTNLSSLLEKPLSVYFCT